MSFLVDPIKDFIHLPSIILARKNYTREDVEEWIPTAFKTLTAAGFFFVSWSIVYKRNLDPENLLLLISSSCFQYALHPYALYISTSYFSMALGVDHLIKGLSQRHTFSLMTGSFVLLSGITGLYRIKAYRKEMGDRYPESYLDQRFHNWAQAIVAWKK
jgi:hypothetical protein